MQQIMDEFDDAEHERQFELFAFGEKVVQFPIIVEPHLTNNIITPVAETVASMADSLEQVAYEGRSRGRPSLKIPKTQLEFLLNHSSEMFGCHRRRRIQECEIENHHFISISDVVLDDIVQSMCTLHR